MGVCKEGREHLEGDRHIHSQNHGNCCLGLFTCQKDSYWTLYIHIVNCMPSNPQETVKKKKVVWTIQKQQSRMENRILKEDDFRIL